MTLDARRRLARECDRVGRSPLLRRGGVAIYRGLFDPPTLDALLDEACACPARLDILNEQPADREQTRGGQPARRIESVAGGALQDSLFSAPALSAFIAGEVGMQVLPCGSRASYTLYRDRGAHLGIHRDIVGCDVTLVTCLHDNDPEQSGGAIDVWFDDTTTPLDELRASTNATWSRLALAPGDSMLLHGGVLPHRVPATLDRRQRIVSLMCFQILAD